MVFMEENFIINKLILNISDLRNFNSSSKRDI